jgi:hypothetical protein
MANDASQGQPDCVEIKQINTPQRHKAHKEAKKTAIGALIRIFVNFVPLWCGLRSFNRFSGE